MKRAKFVVFLAALVFIKIAESYDTKLKIECLLTNQNFWNLYMSLCSETDSIHITTLTTDVNYNYFQYFGILFFKSFYTHTNYTKTVAIRHYHYKNEEGNPGIYVPQATSLNAFLSADSSAFQDVKIINYTKWKRDRHFVAPRKFYMLMVWDVATLNTYLSVRPEDVLATTEHNAGTYAVLFLKNSRSDCGYWNSTKLLQNIVKRFWTEFGVLNVLLHTSCSCLSEEVMVYNPFRMKHGTRGHIKLVHAGKVLKYWFKINNLMDFERYPLRISMFERPLSAVKTIPEYMESNRLYSHVSKSGGYGGLDGLFIYEMTKFFNFSPIITTPKDGDTFGHRGPNGALTGSLGELVYHKADIAGNSRFMVTYDSNEFHFTNPIASDWICLLVPKADTIPRYTMIFRILSWQCWLSVLVVVGIFVVTWVCLRLATVDPRDASNRTSWYDASFEMITIFLDQSTTTNWSTVQRIFLSTCILFNIIFFSIIQGSLFTTFSTISYYKDINTIDDFLERTDLPLLAGLLSIFMDSYRMSALKSRLVRYPHTFNHSVVHNSIMQMIAYDRNVSWMTRKSNAQIDIKTRFTGYDGLPLIHIVQECPASYLIAYGVTKDSPFRPWFNYAINSFLQAGLLHKWHRDMAQGILAERELQTFGRLNGNDSCSSSNNNNDNNAKPLSFEYVQAAFLIWGVGLSVALVAFVGELIVWHVTKGKREVVARKEEEFKWGELIVFGERGEGCGKRCVR